MKALVTGATGFLGSHLARALVEGGHTVRALVRSTSNRSLLRGLDIEYVEGYLQDARSLRKAAEGQDVVFHTAAMVVEWGKKEDFFRINVDGTRNLLDACLAAGVQRCIHTSSLTVLGIHFDTTALDEQSPYTDKHFELYTETKIQSEKLVIEYARTKNLPAIIIRPGIIWGPGDTTFLPRLHPLAKYHLLCYISGGHNPLCLSYVANLVDALILAAESPGAVGSIYNITDSETVTSRMFFSGLSKALDCSPPFYSLPYSIVYGLGGLSEVAAKLLRFKNEPLLTRFAVNLLSCRGTYHIEKARQELGYNPRVTFEEGMKNIARWHRNSSKIV